MTGASEARIGPELRLIQSAPERLLTPASARPRKHGLRNRYLQDRPPLPQPGVLGKSPGGETSARPKPTLSPPKNCSNQISSDGSSDAPLLRFLVSNRDDVRAEA